MFSILYALFLLVATLSQVSAHVGPFAKGMYCKNGPTNQDQQNTDAIVQPLFNLAFKDWWFHHINKCDEFPPPEGEFLELPAGGSFKVELATNRGKTDLSFSGKFASEWLDGNPNPPATHPDVCITNPNIHTQNESMAAGTAFAISYTSDIKKVTPENLVVFSVRHNTPWKRVVYYDVPKEMPACPAGGCICGWGWVPNGCGEPNMYHVPFKCKVTGATSNKVVGTPKPPKWCEGQPSACVDGPKQMIYWNQKEGNNIEVSGFDRSGQHRSPAYNLKLGFQDGAQNNIFVGGSSNGGGSGSSSVSSSSSASRSTGSPASNPSKPTTQSHPPHTTGTANTISSTASASTPTTTTSSRKHCSAKNHSKRSKRHHARRLSARH